MTEQRRKATHMGTIAGRITSPDGEPIANASVMVASGPSHPDLAAITDKKGAFRLDDLEAGEYLIQVNAEGFAKVCGRVPVRPRHVTRADLVLPEEEVPELDDQFEDDPLSRPGGQDKSDAPAAKSPTAPPRGRSKSVY